MYRSTPINRFPRGSSYLGSSPSYRDTFSVDPFDDDLFDDDLFGYNPSDRLATNLVAPYPLPADRFSLNQPYSSRVSAPYHGGRSLAVSDIERNERILAAQEEELRLNREILRLKAEVASLHQERAREAVLLERQRASHQAALAREQEARDEAERVRLAQVQEQERRRAMIQQRARARQEAVRQQALARSFTAPVSNPDQALSVCPRHRRSSDRCICKAVGELQRAIADSKAPYPPSRTQSLAATLRPREPEVVPAPAPRQPVHESLGNEDFRRILQQLGLGIVDHLTAGAKPSPASKREEIARSTVNLTAPAAAPMAAPSLKTRSPEPQPKAKPQPTELNAQPIVDFLQNLFGPQVVIRTKTPERETKQTPTAQAETGPMTSLSAEEKGKGKAKSAAPEPAPAHSFWGELAKSLFENRLQGETDQEVRDTMQAIIESLKDQNIPTSSGATSSKVKMENAPMPSGADLSRAPEIGGKIAKGVQEKFKEHRRASSDTQSIRSSSTTHSVQRPQSPTAPLDRIASIRSSLDGLKTSFTFPPSVDFDDSTEFAFTPTNAPVRAYEHALNGLLAQLDAVESEGDDEVRVRRREAVQAVESALEEVEKQIEQRKPFKPTLSAAEQPSAVVASADVPAVEQPEPVVAPLVTEPEPTVEEAESVEPTVEEPAAEEPQLAPEQPQPVPEEVSLSTDESKPALEEPVEAPVIKDAASVEETPQTAEIATPPQEIAQEELPQLDVPSPGSPLSTAPSSVDVEDLALGAPVSIPLVEEVAEPAQELQAVQEAAETETTEQAIAPEPDSETVSKVAECQEQEQLAVESESAVEPEPVSRDAGVPTVSLSTPSTTSTTSPETSESPTPQPSDSFLATLTPEQFSFPIVRTETRSTDSDLEDSVLVQVVEHHDNDHGSDWSEVEEA